MVMDGKKYILKNLKVIFNTLVILHKVKKLL